MKYILGLLAIIILIFGGVFLSFVSLNSGTKLTALCLFIWTIAFIPIAFWTRTNAKFAFLTALGFYLAGVIVKNALLGGEYILTFLFHIYFITSVIIGSTFKNKDRRSN